MVVIEDGTGKGFKAKVTSENQLRVFSVQVSMEHFVNHFHGQAYNVMFDQSPTASDDCILYMENESDHLDLVVEGIEFQVDGAVEIYTQLNARGTRNGANVIEPANLNTKSGKEASGIFEQGADLDGGGATLTGGVETFRWVFNAANNSTNFNFECDVILGRGNTLTVWCSDNARTVHGLIPMYFLEAD